MSCRMTRSMVVLLCGFGFIGSWWVGRLAAGRMPGFVAINWLLVMSGRHPDLGARGGAGGDAGETEVCRASGGLDAQDGIAGQVLLTRTAPGPLTRDNRAALEDLATPDAPRLRPLDGAGQALDPHGALRAERLG